MRGALLTCLLLGFWSATLHAEPLPSILQVMSPDCHACKFVQAELNKLRAVDAGRLEIETLNIAKDPDRMRRLNVHLVPTLIFYDTNGKELFRHQGRWSAEEIRRKWRELGVELYTSPGA